MKILHLYESAKDTDERLSKTDINSRTATEKSFITTTITVDKTKTAQRFFGFGGALTESSGYVLSKLPLQVRKKAVEACFSPTDGNAYRIARIHMNSCDFSLGNWACVPEKDESLDSFSMARTDTYISPLAIDAQKASNRHLDFLMSPWSPPAWMKDNHNMNHGGHLLPIYKELWAQYFVRFITEMKNRGIDITALTIQNECAAVQSWDSCIWSAEDEGEFAAKYLGPELKKAGLDSVKIYIWDHNRDLAFDRIKESLAVPGAKDFIAGIACHWYSGDQYENLKKIALTFPDKDIIFSEGCIEGGPRNGAWFTGERYAHNIINDIKSGATKWIDWNIALDLQGGPNHAQNFCDAPILVDEKKGVLYFQSSYYYIGHFSRFIQENATVINSTVESWMTPATASGHLKDEIESLACKNPDNTITLVVTNRTEAEVPFTLRIGDEEKKLFCPPRAIQTWIFG